MISSFFQKVITNTIACCRGMNRLMTAAFLNDFKTVEKCLQDHFHIDQRDKYGGTALMCVSLRKDRTEMVKYLLSRGANPNILDKKGRSALLLAVEYGRDKEIIKELIRCGADVNVTDEEGNTLLLLELQHSVPDIEIVKFLIQSGVNISVQNNKGLGAIYACLNRVDIDRNITLLVCQATYPEHKVELLEDYSHPFILSTKNGKLDGPLVRYSHCDMVRTTQLEGYILYCENKRQASKSYAYKAGKVYGQICGIYEDGHLLFGFTDKNNIIHINDLPPSIPLILNNLSVFAEFESGSVQYVNIEDFFINNI